MDANLMALLHVQRALIAALCATHPNPADLESAFAFHLEQTADVLQSSPEMMRATTLWAAAFRKHFPATPD